MSVVRTRWRSGAIEIFARARFEYRIGRRTWAELVADQIERLRALSVTISMLPPASERQPSVSERAGDITASAAFQDRARCGPRSAPVAPWSSYQAEPYGSLTRSSRRWPSRMMLNPGPGPRLRPRRAATFRGAVGSSRSAALRAQAAASGRDRRWGRRNHQGWTGKTTSTWA